MPPTPASASALASVLGVERVRSRTIRGAGEISLLFSAGTDMWRALQLTESRVGETRGALPPGADVVVERVTTTPNPPYVQLLTQYPGLNAFAATYRILSNVKTLGGRYNFTNAVQQDIQMAEIPVFQFAIFYNNLLEFTDCAPLTINGRVHLEESFEFAIKR